MINRFNNVEKKISTCYHISEQIKINETYNSRFKMQPGYNNNKDNRGKKTMAYYYKFNAQSDKYRFYLSVIIP